VLANAAIKARVTVFYCAEGKAASSVTTGAFTVSELFQPNTSTTPVIGMYDEKALTVLADMTVDLNSQVSTAQDVKSFAFSVPLKNAVLNFRESGSAFSNKRNIYIMVTAYTPVVLNEADLGFFSYNYDLAFQDI